MTMLGRVRCPQEDENHRIRTSRPAKTSRTEDFYKAVMVQTSVPAASSRVHQSFIVRQIILFKFYNRSDNFDITRGTILDSELRPEHFNEVTAAIFQKLNQCTFELFSD